MLYQKNCNNFGSNYYVHKENKKFFVDRGMLKSLGAYKAEIFWSIDLISQTWDVEFTTKNHICQNHITLQLKFKKQLTYNYYVTIL
jgi:hypothetical protein